MVLFGRRREYSFDCAAGRSKLDSAVDQVVHRVAVDDEQ
jgi:hypothetical protein